MNKRRSKMFYSYEWKLVGEWEANLKTMVVTRIYKGRFKVPNLSEEFQINEVDVTFTQDDTGFQKLKDFMSKQAPSKIRAQLEKYLVSMRQEYNSKI